MADRHQQASRCRRWSGPKGKAVVTLAWDGGGSAHSGSVVIRASRAGFLVEDEADTYGPFATLDEALALDAFHFASTPGPVLTCSPGIVASAALRVAALDLAGAPDGTVRINGVEHVRTADGLSRLS